MSSKSSDINKWIDKERNQLLNGATRLVLLAIIDKNQQTGIHGYSIAAELEAQTQGEISKSKASFYAILRRLVDDNLIDFREGDSLKGPPRKYYFLTEEGKLAMTSLYQNWTHYFDIISRFDNLKGE